MGQWVGWLAGHGVPLLEADETAVAVWARRMEATGENTTAARKLTAVSSFYAWCLGRGDVHANPLADLARSAVDYDTSAIPGLTRDQAAAPLATADADADPRSNGMPSPSALFMHLQVGSRQTGAPASTTSLSS
jgi:integrase/recombinase XerD